MHKENQFARICWKNWYRDFRIAARSGDISEFEPGKSKSWERFWGRRLRALEQFLHA